MDDTYFDASPRLKARRPLTVRALREKADDEAEAALSALGACALADLTKLLTAARATVGCTAGSSEFYDKLGWLQARVLTAEINAQLAASEPAPEPLDRWVLDMWRRAHPTAPEFEELSDDDRRALGLIVKNLYTAGLTSAEFDLDGVGSLVRDAWSQHHPDYPEWSDMSESDRDQARWIGAVIYELGFQDTRTEV